MTRQSWLALCAVYLALVAPAALARSRPLAAAATAASLDRQLDWSRARLIVVQDAGRYKTLESFARESLAAMTGREHLPGLSPLASLFEWLFNRSAYDDAPLIRVRDKGVRIHLAVHLPEQARRRVIETGYLTPRELQDPVIRQRMRELETRNLMIRALGRLRDAEAVATLLERFLRIVPADDPSGTAPWYTPWQLRANLPEDVLKQAGIPSAALAAQVGGPVPDISAAEAIAVLAPWSRLRAAWLRGDAEGAQSALDELSTLLPTLAPAGVYPAESQRAAEARYYRMGKLTWGWIIYFLGTLVSIWALVTRWRTPWLLGLGLLGVALAIHAYGIGLRWYILGHIPVANMFEAVISSAWMGVALGLLVELRYRTRVFLLGAHATGFFALVVGGYIIPGRGSLTSLMGILDDVMLRLHTVMIIAAYALIFLAAVIATVYLIGYYLVPHRARQAAVGRGAATSLRQRPILAGALPGDSPQTPSWLEHMDWSHLIILNLVFVLLFVGGVVLGAVWADYSWGRPWGWDPKEVFALNTWIVYAILIHVRFVVKAKGLWTAWLSVAGCLMMLFNWWIVNYYIVGLHSYA